MKCVLLIDDEPEIGPLVSMCLDPLGVEVIWVGDLATALERATSGDIGLVLLDLALGTADGLEILPRLRDEPGLVDVPVIAFSAHDSRRREALNCGVEAFLARPFVSSDLQSAVEQHLKA